MEHSITIEENPVDDSNTTEENPVYEKRCITKVHVGLRNVKPEAYKPVVVSIGPYYHKCNPDRYPGLEEMQRSKQLYLDSLLERRNRSRDYYLSELKKLATKARKCYAGSMSTIDDNEFTEMMLLDSCFVVEFIRKVNYVPSDENDPIPDDVKAAFDDDDPIGTVPGRLNQIKRDMILLENQLPYFVLSKFYDMTKYNGEKSLEEMAMSCFNASLPRPRHYFNNSNGEKINHLLHLVHIFCRPSAQRHDSSAKEVGKSRSFNGNSDQNSPLLKKNPKDGVGSSNENSVNRDRYEPDISIDNHIGTVVELQEAGVNFQKVDKVYIGELLEGTGNDYVSLFDIDFQREEMKVPCFKVDASTETLLRNLIAYEQEYFKDVKPKYFTDFAMLMNQLINTENDTKVLRYQNIIINFLPDDKDVCQLFNTLTHGVCDSLEPYFLQVRKDVDKHCKTPIKRLRAFSRRNCFKDPCVTASTIAAAILLGLTVVQLIIALLTWLDIYP